MEAFAKYAEYYDLIYRDKDYEKECDFLQAVFSRFSPRPVAAILDLGCGTGRHSIPLAGRGYQITGIDRSESMINIARSKVEGSGLDIGFNVMDLMNLELGRRFDTAICLFNVMGYLISNQNIQTALSNIRRHLKTGALFISDFWNGLAVLRILPSPEKLTFEDKGITLLRTAQPELDAFKHICRVNYRLQIIKDERAKETVTETHDIRFFFPQEIIHYLEEASFQLLRIHPFLDIDGAVDENVWNMTAIAKAI